MLKNDQKRYAESASVGKTILEAVLKAYHEQRNPIPDSDLDNEQPISLNVSFTLGDLRKLDHAVRTLKGE